MLMPCFQTSASVPREEFEMLDPISTVEHHQILGPEAKQSEEQALNFRTSRLKCLDVIMCLLFVHISSLFFA